MNAQERSDPVLWLLRASLPQETLDVCQKHLAWLEDGDYPSILNDTEAQRLLHRASDGTKEAHEWLDNLFTELNQELAKKANDALPIIFFCIGYAALLGFLQANVTGPPLSWDSQTLFLQAKDAKPQGWHDGLQDALLDGMSLDGIAPYRLTLNIELLCVAETILASPTILKTVRSARWVKARATLVHQRLLTESSSSLESTIDRDIAMVKAMLHNVGHSIPSNVVTCLWLEEAIIKLYYGHDQQARQCLDKATELRGFEYKLTGRLGKRTKYQQHDISQLVVLAKSKHEETTVDPAQSSDLITGTSERHAQGLVSALPQNLDLNDDTLLERISFTDPEKPSEHDSQQLPPSLSQLDPSNQPLLDPLDSIILLSYASSITNTSPEHGLTREEMLPYATRVLTGGSNNWQVYTQALLVRSRIEGFSSRTTERGLLQLQALVDQITVDLDNTDHNGPVSSFLPAVKTSESAPVQERLRYIFQLASPMRRELEAELASRWVQLGGLRTALDIYERLEMWAEAALCLAATEQEDKARTVIRNHLFEAREGEEGSVSTLYSGQAISPPPADAPRLYCILGDLDQSTEYYEAAWTVSKQRYARAQRSLGRLYLTQRKLKQAVDAYSKSLSVNQLNQQSWFALGCALMELESYSRAAEAFSRCVQLDDSDAEAWSNLGASLLRIDHSSAVSGRDDKGEEDIHDNRFTLSPNEKNTHARQKDLSNALKAFQRASGIKHDSYRIWYNMLVTAASVSPPDYATVLTAQKRIIDLRGSTEGESCIDVEILERLIDHIIRTTPSYDPGQPGIARMCMKLIDESVSPLVSASSRLWQLLSRVWLWRRRPGSALDAEEKAWRAALAQPGWEDYNEKAWSAVVDATIRLCDAYESLGPQEKTEGLASGTGQLVAKDWKYKARTAIKSVLNKAKDAWEETEDWNRLKDMQQTLVS